MYFTVSYLYINHYYIALQQIQHKLFNFMSSLSLLKLKKLLYRSVHRGCKETDYILGGFAKRYLHLLNDSELAEYEKLIEVDDNTFYSWLTYTQPIPAEYDTNVYRKILHYHQLKGYKKIFIIAGEASGDLIASKLINQLKEIELNLDIYGIGGAHMKAAGAELLFEYSQIAVMGFAEVIPSIPRIWRLLKRTVSAIKERKPDVVVTIDSAGFNFRIAKKIRGLCPIVHYVAPAVWAYKPKRAQQMEKLFDHLLLLLPFEQPFFNAQKLPTTFVGHHIVEDMQQRTKHFLDGTLRLLVMPGSRKQEIKRMGHIFAQSIRHFTQHHRMHKVEVKILTLPHLRAMVEEVFGDLGIEIVDDSNQKANCMLWADIGLVKSGTSAIEATAFGLPIVVAYKMSWLTYYYLKNIISTKFITVTNILLNKLVIPELVQQDCNVVSISTALEEIAQTNRQEEITRDYKQAIQMLNNPSGLKPSALAAETILKVCTKVAGGPLLSEVESKVKDV
jgi:lipid-A-disaccharide synthase